MSQPDTTTRYAVIHRDDALWVAIDAREFEINLDDARAAAEYWSEKDAPHRIIRIDATLTDVTEETKEST
jgi:hypothetical protein